MNSKTSIFNLSNRSSGWIRGCLFWLLVLLSGGTLYFFIAPLSFYELTRNIAEAIFKNSDRIADRNSVQSLATAIVSRAAGICVAYGLMHAWFITRSIKRACGILSGAKSKRGFDENFDALSAKLSAHELLGHAWDKFGECIIRKEGEPLRNTQRPQSYFTYTMLRERLPGLKFMTSIPGYFVGVGLVLTFIGLVFALHQAAEGTQAAHQATGGKGAEAMKTALENLLQAASFKFSTSIAGLGASIALSFAFRLYTINIESALSRFCQTLETKMTYLAPQSVAVKMSESLSAQLDQIKEINGDKFFARLGDKVAPAIDTAMTKAVIPLAEQIGSAVKKLRQNSETGVDEMLKRFSETIHGGAGTELVALRTSLEEVRKSMDTVRFDMGRSGQDFATQLGEAAVNLRKMIEETGRGLGKQSAENTRELEKMRAVLTDVFERASQKVDENLATAADGASSKLTAAMDRVLQKLEGQVNGLEQSFGGFRDTAAGHLATLRRQMEEAQGNGIKAVSATSAGAAKALEEGLSGAIGKIGSQIEKFVQALQASTTSLDDQIKAMDELTGRTKENAQTFGRVAEAVRTAVDPVTRSNERLEAVTAKFEGSFAEATVSLKQGQQATTALANSLNEQVSALKQAWQAYNAALADGWNNYRTRFEKVDEDLQRAFDKLAAGTQEQTHQFAERIGQIDDHLADAVKNLAAPVAELNEGAQSIADSVAKLKEALARRQAA